MVKNLVSSHNLLDKDLGDKINEFFVLLLNIFLRLFKFVCMHLGFVFEVFYFRQLFSDSFLDRGLDLFVFVFDILEKL